MLRQLNAVLVLMTTSSSPFSTAAIFAATSAWRTLSKEFFRMKKSLICALLTLALTCCGTALYAQQDTMSQGAPQASEHRMPSADQRLQRMTKMLNLTPDQQAKIKPILDNEQTQMQGLHQDSSLSRDDRMSKAQSIRQGSNTEIQQILTPDQQQKWTQMQQERHGGMGQGGGAPKLQ